MPLIDSLFSVGRIRKAVWRLWYPFLTRRLHGEEVLFLNYAFETEPPMNLPLAPDDEKNRAGIQLYHHVATQVPLAGKNVLEVSCGHGGGASYLTRTLRPKSYTGLDLNPAGIRFCRERHRVAGLEFINGDAENLPFAADTFDAVINVEASHCYPDFPKFLAEVARALRPGGHFLYADFRFRERWAEWDAALAAAGSNTTLTPAPSPRPSGERVGERGLDLQNNLPPLPDPLLPRGRRGRNPAPLQLLATRNINAEVLRGMEKNSARSQALIARRLPKLLHGIGRDFAGTRGSRIFNALTSGELSYRSYCFVKKTWHPRTR